MLQQARRRAAASASALGDVSDLMVLLSFIPSGVRRIPRLGRYCHNADKPRYNLTVIRPQINCVVTTLEQVIGFTPNLRPRCGRLAKSNLVPSR